METYAVIVPSRPYSFSSRLYWSLAESDLSYDEAYALAGEFAQRQPLLPPPIIEKSHLYRFSWHSAVNRQPQMPRRYPPAVTEENT